MCCGVLPCVAVCCGMLQFSQFFPFCFGMLQCVGVCCSVLQCVAVFCSVLLPARRQSACRLLWRDMLQCVVVCYGVLQCVAVCFSVLQCVAVCCSVLQCVAVSFYLRDANLLVGHSATYCNTLQHTATLPAKRQSPCRLVWLSSTQNNYCSAGTGKIITSQLYSHFTWCILSQDDFWEYLPVAAATWRRSIRLRRPGVSKETYIHQKRRIYIKRKVYKSKEAYINQKRRT